MEQPLLSFKAGRSYRRGTTNFIDPAPEKGLIEMRVGVDELLHFHWVNRDTNESEVVCTSWRVWVAELIGL